MEELASQKVETEQLAAKLSDAEQEVSTLQVRAPHSFRAAGCFHASVQPHENGHCDCSRLGWLLRTSSRTCVGQPVAWKAP